MTAPTPSILVTRRLPASVEDALSSSYRAVLSADDRQLSVAELKEALLAHDIVLCTLTDHLTREVLEVDGRRTALLANFGVGTNHIDLGAAHDAGVVVTNTPGVLTEDTADLTMLLLLAVARRAFEGDRELRAGEWTGWRPTHLLGARVSGKTLGLVGLGRIGRAVARRAAAGFGMQVRYWSRRRLSADEERALNVEWRPSLEALTSDADFVSVHCPATPETRRLIDANALRHFRPAAFLINTSRGDVVDERALLAALREGALAGAALDVFDGEPHVNPELLSHPALVTLPHLGSATVEARVAMGECAIANIRAFVAGEPPPNRVA